MQSAHNGGVAHWFTSVAPLLITDPALARPQCQRMATELLTARLSAKGNCRPEDVVASSVSAGITDPAHADTLRECLGHKSAERRTADAVTQILQTVLALGRRRQYRHGGGGRLRPRRDLRLVLAALWATATTRRHAVGIRCGRRCRRAPRSRWRVRVTGGAPAPSCLLDACLCKIWHGCLRPWCFVGQS
jgi:hypothetical protein